MKNSNSDIISLHVYNNSPYIVTLPLRLIGYCETNATISTTKEVAYRVYNILQLLDICQSTTFDEEFSINNIIKIKNETQTISRKHLILNQHFKYQNTQKNNKQSSILQKIHRRTTNNVQFQTLSDQTKRI